MKAYLMNWSFMRVLRLVLGGVILVQGIMVHEVPYAVIGGLLALMAIANIGCNGGACGVPMRSVNTSSPKTVEFEEIKSEKE